MLHLAPALILALALPLAFVLGFSAHRAGICTVKAVAEVFTTRSAALGPPIPIPGWLAQLRHGCGDVCWLS
ncbi:hypothetical protein HBA54_18720 [Pelagibius litoralis]|uniref:Uncharacterized protein n=1 Tax=Pelagibius litoralis TaxID=374515 RepID=A0A967KE97_9PROT|nr:hypothetical protein [Pelagibius litoralis]NIA70635.1 hypothetical protein [Pelagibius litoralis]